MRNFLGFLAAAGAYGVASVLIAAVLFCISVYEQRKLSTMIESILTLYNQSQNMTAIAFAAMLTNRGAPSHAIGWRVRYQSDSIDITVKYVSLPQEKVNFGAIGGRTLVLKRQDLLPARCLPMVERGETKHGRILFEIPGDRRQEIYSGNALMRLTFDDNAHRICEGLFKATGEMNNLQAYPDEEVF